jgi:hypothetical protein
MDDDIEKLDSMVILHKQNYKKRKAKIFYEAAVSELLETHSLDEAEKIMISYIEHLKEI